MTESPWPSAHQYSIALRNDRGNAGSHQNHRVTPPARVALGALPAPVAYPLQMFGAKQKRPVFPVSNTINKKTTDDD